MFCSHCGKENAADAQFCTQCGKRLVAANPQPEPQPNPQPADAQAQPQQQTASTPVPPPAPGQQQQNGYQQQPPAAAPQPQQNYAPATGVYPMTSQDETLRLINFILCILSCIAVCWAVVPLAWMIPMTVHSWGIYKGTKPNTTAFGVCTLIFLNVIGGILLLVSNKDQ